MSSDYDLAIIGSGMAARVTVMRVRKPGWRIAMIDNRPYGGICALRGCDPKKVLRGGAAAVDHARRMRGKGVVGEAAFDWRKLLNFKNSFTDPIPDMHERNYRDHGIDTYYGSARFTGPNGLAAAAGYFWQRPMTVERHALHYLVLEI